MEPSTSPRLPSTSPRISCENCFRNRKSSAICTSLYVLMFTPTDMVRCRLVVSGHLGTGRASTSEDMSPSESRASPSPTPDSTRACPSPLTASAVSSSSASAVCHSLTARAYARGEEMTRAAARAAEVVVVPLAETLSCETSLSFFSLAVVAVASSTSATVFLSSLIAAAYANSEAVV